MKAVGDVVARDAPGRSEPRGAVAPPQTRTSFAHGLDGVIGRGEEPEVGGRRHVLARGSELGQPETVEVGLVADDQVADLREVVGDGGRIGRELRACLVGQRCRRGARLVDDHEQADVGGICGCCQAVGARRPRSRRARSRRDPRRWTLRVRRSRTRSTRRRSRSGLPIARRRRPRRPRASVRSLLRIRPRGGSLRAERRYMRCGVCSSSEILNTFPLRTPGNRIPCPTQTRAYACAGRRA